jgi:hypothetical protein
VLARGARRAAAGADAGLQEIDRLASGSCYSSGVIAPGARARRRVR